MHVVLLVLAVLVGVWGRSLLAWMTPSFAFTLGGVAEAGARVGQPGCPAAARRCPALPHGARCWVRHSHASKPLACNHPNSIRVQVNAS